MENLNSDDKGTDNSYKSKIINTSKFADRLFTAGWGLLFIWIGIALLLELGASIIMLGIGTIILLVQVISKYLNFRIRLFYVVTGLLFMAGGFWHNYKPDFPLIPVFLIVVGTGLLLTFIK